MNDVKVLVVEDENIIGMEIMSRLEYLGFQVPAVVTTGELAIEKTAEYEPQLILMDIRLKGECDGIDAARRIKEKYQTPIIYLTAYADERTIQRAQTVSDNLIYLLKPFSEEELKTAVKKALNGRSE